MRIIEIEKKNILEEVHNFFNINLCIFLSQIIIPQKKIENAILYFTTKLNHWFPKCEQNRPNFTELIINIVRVVRVKDRTKPLPRL